MRTKLFNIWEKLRSSYWFVPTLMAMGAFLLAYGALRMDEIWKPKWLWHAGWFYRNEPEGAREILSTVAGGMITVTGVVFSITVVALTLASQQFGPRLLYNFMRDRGNQLVFGTFIATYLYCLLVLRTIRQGADAYVPHLSVFLGFVLAVVSLMVLIYFIHHVAESIQAMTIIATVHGDLQKTIARLLPVSYEQESRRTLAQLGPKLPDDFTARAVPVRAARDGYLQATDQEGLLELAKNHDLLIRLEQRPGDYVIRDSVLARVLPAEEEKAGEWQKAVQEACILGRKRTQEQDIEFLLHELVEIGVRALSPGINDPYTAITCIDRIGSALAAIAGLAMPSPLRCDAEGRLRLVVRPWTYEGLVDSCFNQLRQFGLGYVAVTIRLLETIDAVIPFTRDEAQRAPLLRQAGMIDRGAGAAFPEEFDRKEIHARYLAIFATIEQMTGISGSRR